MSLCQSRETARDEEGGFLRLVRSRAVSRKIRTHARQRKDREDGKRSDITASTILTVVVLVSLVVFGPAPVGEAKPHDLDKPLSSGVHIYVDYESSWSFDDQRVTSGNLTVYLQEECHCGFDQSFHTFHSILL